MNDIAVALAIAAAACLLLPDRTFARTGPAGIVFGALALLVWFGPAHH